MTKTASFAALALLAGSVSFAAPRPENSTYVDGTIAAFKPNTGGTLVFNDKDAMLFKTPLGQVAVPYTGIQRAELGTPQAHSSSAPAHKVWSLPRMHRTETQLLTLEFKSKAGEDQTMKLELAKPVASVVLAQIQDRTNPKKAATNGQSWWGDSYWKTERNAATWDNQTAAARP